MSRPTTQRVVRLLGRLLQLWGALSLLLVVGVAAWFAWSWGPGAVTRVDQASPQDVAFVLNWSGLGAARIEAVEHSHVSPRIFGDHLEAYAIRLTPVDAHELKGPDLIGDPAWYRGDQLPEPLSKAVDLAAGWPELAAWLPSGEAIRTAEVYVQPVRIVLDGLRPTAVQLILLRPATRTLYYVDVST